MIFIKYKLIFMELFRDFIGVAEAIETLRILVSKVILLTQGWL